MLSFSFSVLCFVPLHCSLVLPQQWVQLCPALCCGGRLGYPPRHGARHPCPCRSRVPKTTFKFNFNFNFNFHFKVNFNSNFKCNFLLISLCCLFWLRLFVFLVVTAGSALSGSPLWWSTRLLRPPRSPPWSRSFEVASSSSSSATKIRYVLGVGSYLVGLRICWHSRLVRLLMVDIFITCCCVSSRLSDPLPKMRTWKKKY